MSESNTELEPVNNYTYAPAEPMSKGETAAVVTLVVAVVGGLAALIRWDYKEQKRIAAEQKAEREAREAERKAEVDEFNEWCDAQPGNGKIIVKPQVGTYIAIPVEHYKDVEIKRLPGVTY